MIEEKTTPQGIDDTAPVEEPKAVETDAVEPDVATSPEAADATSEPAADVPSTEMSAESDAVTAEAAAEAESTAASAAPGEQAEVSAAVTEASAPDQPAAEAPKAEEAPTASEATDEAPAASEPAATATVTDTPAPAPAASEPEASEVAPAKVDSGKTEDEKLFEAAFASLGSEEPTSSREVGGVSGLTKGERITAKVIQVENDKVFVDLGTKAEGVVPLSELASENLLTAVGHVKPGDTFEVIVLKPYSSDGNPVVSKRRADFDVQWQRILDSFEQGEVFQANVVDRVKGGLVVDIGVRGFVPATHVGSGKLRNIEKYVGQILAVKIIEVDRERRKVVLSNRVAEEERRGEVKDEIFSNVKPHDVLEGTVRRLTDYGAFIDLGGIDGLLHISEMSWARIDHPREVLKEGDEIKVMVLRLDQGNGRISLGLRQVLPDPWNLIRENYKLGQKVKLTVTRMVQSGAFIKLPEGAEAFLPLSEVSDDKVKKPQDVLEDGQEIEVTIIDLRPDERRMVLSLRENPQVGGYRGDTGGGGGGFGANMRSPRRGGGGGPRGGGKKRDGEASDGGGQRMPTGGATIGERLGILKGLMKGDNGDAKDGAGE